MASHDTASDFALPAFDARALARRAAVPAALAAAVAAALIVAGGPLHAFADALERALDADPRWVAAAAAFEILSFGGYVALLWLVGRRASPRLGLAATAQISLGGAAATRLLPTGGVGGVALTVWALRKAGLGARAAARTLLAFLVLLYGVFFAAMATAGALLATGAAGTGGPLLLSAVPAAAGALVVIVALGAGARRRDGMTSGTPEATPGRRARARAMLGDAAGTLGAAVRDAIALVRSGDLRLVGAPVWWAFDAAVLWAMLHAFGAPPSVAVLVLAYFVGQVGNTIPIPGAVSGGMVGLLLAFGVPADLALVSVLAYRAVAIWLPAPIGLVALGALRRTVARWSREDAAAAEPEVFTVVQSSPPHAAPVPHPAWPCPEPAMRAAA